MALPSASAAPAIIMPSAQRCSRKTASKYSSHVFGTGPSSMATVASSSHANFSRNFPLRRVTARAAR
eukprot:8289747-Alexandrium_andersonii.AAC.1